MCHSVELPQSSGYRRRTHCLGQPNFPEQYLELLCPSKRSFPLKTKTAYCVVSKTVPHDIKISLPHILLLCLLSSFLEINRKTSSNLKKDSFTELLNPNPRHTLILLRKFDTDMIYLFKNLSNLERWLSGYHTCWINTRTGVWIPRTHVELMKWLVPVTSESSEL